MTPGGRRLAAPSVSTRPPRELLVVEDGGLSWLPGVVVRKVHVGRESKW